MEKIDAKKVNGHTYYYYSKWEWLDGRCRRIWQKYLGKPQHIANMVLEGGPAPQFAEIFQWGLPNALWRECSTAQIIPRV